MILYLAGAEQENPEVLKQLNKCNLLFSYIWNPSKVIDIPHNNIGSLSFVDSGAFSAWTRNISISVDDYISWLNANDKYLDLFGQLDNIPGDKKLMSVSKNAKDSAQCSWNNYLYMRARVLSPSKLLYTFHVGEPKEFLERALNWTDENGLHIPYIALGGLVGKSTSIRRNFLNMCFNMIHNSANSKVKVHTFGMTEISLLEEFPITSADSSGWLMRGVNGKVITDYGSITVSEKLRFEPDHYLQVFKDSEQLKEFEQSLLRFGFSINDLINSRENRLIYNGRYLSNRLSKIKYKGGSVVRQALF